MFLSLADPPALVWPALVVLAVALLLQGSAWPRQTADMVAAMAAAPLLFVVLVRPEAAGGVGWLGRCERLFPWLLPLLVLAQTIPLPPEMWRHLPGRAAVAEVIAATGAPLDWMPLSLTPASAPGAVLFLMAPIALYLATLRLSWSGRRLLLALVVAGAGLQVVVGLAQSVFGAQSLWNFYGNVDAQRSTGLFASQNHYPAALYMALPLVGALGLRLGERRSGLARWSVAAALVALAMFLLVGALLSRSRAGIAMSAGAVVLSGVVFIAGRWRGVGGRAALVAGLVGVLPFLWVIDREFGRIQSRFGTSLIDDYRAVIFGNVSRGIERFFPAGSGFGSFVDVYQGLEKPADLIPAFVNFAHDDYLQIVLEGGAVGVALLAVFLLWYVWRAGQAVFGAAAAPAADGVYERRAAAISLFLVLLHSTVEYPLRTGALAAVFAVLAGILATTTVRGGPMAVPGAGARSAGASGGVPDGDASAGAGTGRAAAVDDGTAATETAWGEAGDGNGRSGARFRDGAE
jgi:O-antigen ligase